MGVVDGSLPPQDIVAGKYRIERVIGMGAMGVVAAATHIELDQLRAIKFMLPSAPPCARSIERFLREARAAVRLRSQHVARVHDVGRLESGAPYIVMEYLEGIDLKKHLCEHGPLPIGDAVLYMIQACEALAEAHAAGVVHRDLKPSNLFLTKGVGGAPCLKVLDFGIAKLSTSGGDDLTGTSVSLGTPSYMSPEQLRSTRNVDARSDIWSLGVVLYVMLTGRRPFEGDGYSGICASVTADSVSPPSRLRRDLPAAIEAIVLRCLEKAPARRYQCAAELAGALAPFLPKHLQGIDVAGFLRTLDRCGATSDDRTRPEATSSPPVVQREEKTANVLTLGAPDPTTRCSDTQRSAGVGVGPARGLPAEGRAGSADEIEVDLRDTFVADSELGEDAPRGAASVPEAGGVRRRSPGSQIRATAPTRGDPPRRPAHGGLLAVVVFGTVFFGLFASSAEPDPSPGSSARRVPQPAPAHSPVPFAPPPREAPQVRSPPSTRVARSAGPGDSEARRWTDGAPLQR